MQNTTDAMHISDSKRKLYLNTTKNAGKLATAAKMESAKNITNLFTVFLRKCRLTQNVVITMPRRNNCINPAFPVSTNEQSTA
jgi:hypothetical protein